MPKWCLAGKSPITAGKKAISQFLHEIDPVLQGLFLLRRIILVKITAKNAIIGENDKGRILLGKDASRRTL